MCTVMRASARAAWSMAGALVLVLPAAGAAQAQDFYAGKRLTILVNYDAGGPTDIEARLIARHIVTHIPGQPNVIVQNMGGAGGIIGAKYLGEKGPRDGTMVGYFTAAAQHAAFAPEKFTVDFRTYDFVAYMPNGRIHFMRTDLKPGIKRARDVLKAQGVVAGGLTSESPKDLAMRMVLDMLGVPHKYVTGYNSSSHATLAFQRGELNFYSDSPSAYISKIEPAMVKKGEVIPVCFDPIYRAGEFVVPKQIVPLGITSCVEMIRQVRGAMPTGPMAEAYIALLSFAGTMYRTLTLPPSAPPVALAQLRKAMQSLNDDKAYSDDAQRTIGEAPDYVTSGDLNADARRLLTAAPAVQELIGQYARQAKK
mgnify:CR=1 FL=1